MRNRFLIAAGLALMGVFCTANAEEMHQNPFLAPYTTPYEIPPFEQIQYSDYLPALEAGIAQKKAEIDAIVNNPAEPTFENTIMPLENSGEIFDKVTKVFFALSESDSSPEMTEISETFMPAVTKFSDELTMNDKLFARIKRIYDNRDKAGLAPDQKRAVEEYYKNFTLNGALLPAEKKAELMKVNSRLAELYLQFNKNLLSATNSFSVKVSDPAELAGLPESSIQQAADEAKARNLGENKWVFTLHAPSRLPLLQYADNRDLRRKVYEGYTSLASSAPYDNHPVISEILKYRARKAALLGFKDFASYSTSKVMAKTPQNAENLLMQIWKPSVKKVNEEVAEMQAIADKEGAGITIQPWDYYYYAEKVRKAKYDLDENTVRQYFALDSVRNGIFNMAERLYGIKFTPMPDAPKYNPEVTVFDVTDSKTGEHIAVFMSDYFPRASKRQGAWMSEFKGSWTNPDGTSSRPIIYNVGNFSRPSGDTPALLTLDEVETMFHEFGHGLHGMLTRARLKSQAGTNVDRDFVELPSQIHEHWALEPELLRTYAKHWKTGEVIPDELIAKLEASSTHNQGFAMTERVSAALLDLFYGTLNPEGDTDVEAIEKDVTARLGVPSQLTYRYRPTYFKHIFGSDEYSSGYYTYMWAEVLDTDGFELFKEKGVFDPETARKFRENVLEKGGSVDPMTLYVNFRGSEPKVDALLRKHGLEPEANIDLESKTGK